MDTVRIQSIWRSIQSNPNQSISMDIHIIQYPIGALEKFDVFRYSTAWDAEILRGNVHFGVCEPTLTVKEDIFMILMDS